MYVCGGRGKCVKWREREREREEEEKPVRLCDTVPLPRQQPTRAPLYARHATARSPAHITPSTGTAPAPPATSPSTRTRFDGGAASPSASACARFPSAGGSSSASSYERAYPSDADDGPVPDPAPAPGPGCGASGGLRDPRARAFVPVPGPVWPPLRRDGAPFAGSLT